MESTKGRKNTGNSLEALRIQCCYLNRKEDILGGKDVQN